MAQRLYVNEFLQAETSPKKQKAIVNRVAGMLEIAFFTPVGRNRRIDAKNLVVTWCKKMFPDHALFRQCTFPHSQTCLLANTNTFQPKFKNCLTSTQQKDWNGHVASWDAIDAKGRICDMSPQAKGNVYAAIIVTEEYFLKINPDIDLKNYVFSKNYIAL